MQIVIAPRWGAKNPYQRLLAEGLERAGVGVRFAGVRNANLLQSALPPEAEPYDVLHLQWTTPLVLGRTPANSILRGAYLLRDLARRRAQGVRIVWTVHDLVNQELRHQAIEAYWNRRIGRIADRVIVHSEYAKGEVVRSFGTDPAKVHVVPHGHYADFYPRTLSRGEARARLGIANDCRVFLFFGRVRAYKGVDDLLTAFGGLADPNARLIIAGKPETDGIEKAVLSHALADARILPVLRRIEDEELQVYMNASNAVVVPLRYNLTSGSAVAALSFGRPVIGPAIGAITSVVPPDGGIVYQAADPRGLEKALHQAAGADLDAMGDRALAHIRAFSWDRVARETLAVYDLALSAGRSPVRTAMAHE